MRIIAGQHRGTVLADLKQGDELAYLRPTTDRVRESLFNVLSGGRFGNPIQNATVLDLFAGTGALGLEALSRGASSARFVDSGKVAQRLIAENIAKVQRQSDCQLIRSEIEQLSTAKHQHDLIFLDPPYGKSLGQKALLHIRANGWLANDALIVWEENAAQIAPNGFQTLGQRRYGATWINIMALVT